MANFFTGFAEYPTGVVPSDWTERWDASGIFKVQAGGDDQVLKASQAASNRYICTRNDVDADANRDNTEALVLLKTLSVAAGGYHAGCVVRASGTGTTETCYRAVIVGDDLEVGRYVNATGLTLVTAPLTLLADTWYYLRFRVNGTSLKARIWGKAASEPVVWDIDTTDTAIAGVGWAGVFTYDIAADPEFDSIAIATNGDTASAGGGGTTLSPSLLTNSQTFYAPTVSAGAVTLTPSLYSNAQTFYAATVTPGSVTLTPALYTDADSFFAPTVIQDGALQTLTPARYSDPDTFFAPTVVLEGGTQTITPSLYIDADSFFLPTVSQYQAGLTPWTTVPAASGIWATATPASSIWTDI